MFCKLYYKACVNPEYVQNIIQEKSVRAPPLKKSASAPPQLEVGGGLVGVFTISKNEKGTCLLFWLQPTWPQSLKGDCVVRVDPTEEIPRFGHIHVPEPIEQFSKNCHTFLVCLSLRIGRPKLLTYGDAPSRLSRSPTTTKIHLFLWALLYNFFSQKHLFFLLWPKTLVFVINL